MNWFVGAHLVVTRGSSCGHLCVSWQADGACRAHVYCMHKLLSAAAAGGSSRHSPAFPCEGHGHGWPPGRQSTLQHEVPCWCCMPGHTKALKSGGAAPRDSLLVPGPVQAPRGVVGWQLPRALRISPHPPRFFPHPPSLVDAERTTKLHVWGKKNCGQQQHQSKVAKNGSSQQHRRVLLLLRLQSAACALPWWQQRGRR